MKINSNDSRIEKKPRTGVTYLMCMLVKDKTDGKLYCVDFSECLSNMEKYEVVDECVNVPADSINPLK